MSRPRLIVILACGVVAAGRSAIAGFSSPRGWLYPLDDITGAIEGAAVRIHRELGPGPS